ncbi:hypothetical protein C1646_753535 [Rhizophagus diaphanus]|nr:hypothetical protein C1646_753535 [Rhizophagus diaphanus] [Rhizophagus sp. MUCL 43196]
MPKQRRTRDFNSMNNEFSERLDKIENEVVETNVMDKDNVNENKKRVVATQGSREDSDDE